MERIYLAINAERAAYEPGQVGHTMTVGELISFLENYNDETPVVLSHDNGYMYGKLTEKNFKIKRSSNE